MKKEQFVATMMKKRKNLKASIGMPPVNVRAYPKKKKGKKTKVRKGY